MALTNGKAPGRAAFERVATHELVSLPPDHPLARVVARALADARRAGKADERADVIAYLAGYDGRYACEMIIEGRHVGAAAKRAAK